MLMKEPVIFGSFLAGTPYVETRQSSFLPTVPRPPRLPRYSRARRLESLTSRLGNSQSTTSQSSFPGGVLRKSHVNRLGPYDRKSQPPKRSQEEAESRLTALENRAKHPQSQVVGATSPLPTYKWGDEQVEQEFRKLSRRPSQKQSISVPLEQHFEESPKFDFKFSTPMPTTFRFGGQFTSPPRSGAPEYIRSAEKRASDVDKSKFTFNLPLAGQSPRTRFIPKQSQFASETKESLNKSAFGDRIHGDKLGTETKGPQFAFQLPPKSDRTLPLQSQPFEKQAHPTDDLNPKNSFTIIAEHGSRDKPLIRKTLPKSQTFAYRLDTHLDKAPMEDTQLAQSFPQSYPPAAHDVLPTPSASPGHRRTKSVATPTRSSRRARFTSTYAEDSHRGFIRELRSALGQQKAKRDQEEKAIEEQIKKLREEGKAVEKSLAGEIPRLPELLARKVHEALFDTPDDAVVVQNSFGKILGRDIHRLQKGEWLNDELINYYHMMLRERSYQPEKFIKKSHTKGPKKALPKVHAFNSFFYTLLSTRGYSGVRRWTKKAKVNLFEVDRVLIPINKGGFHWILCVVNVTERRIEYYDSMGREGESSENRPVLQNVRSYMMEEAKAQNRSPDEVANWSFYVPVLLFA
jgi:hypothetical protein